MSASRMLLYFFGILLVIIAISVFFFETGLANWVPVGLLVAGILLIIGLAVMGFAEDAPSERTHRHGDAHGDDGDVTIVKK